MRATAVFLVCLLGLLLSHSSAIVLVYGGTARFEADQFEASNMDFPKKSRVYFVVDFDTAQVTGFYFFKQLGVKRYKEDVTTGLRSRTAQLADGRTASVLADSVANSTGDLFSARLAIFRGPNGSVTLKKTPLTTTVRPLVLTSREFDVASNASVGTFYEIFTTATLNRSATLKANTSGQTFAEVAATLRQSLEARGYTPLP